MAEQLTKQRRKRRYGLPAAFGLVTVLLLLLALVLGFGKGYHLSVQVDTERVSPTLAGADERADFDLMRRLRDFSVETDFSLPELYDSESEIGKRLAAAGEIDSLVQQLTDYLGSFDASLAGQNGMGHGLRTLLAFVSDAKLLLALYAVLLAALLLLGVWLLARGKPMGALVLLGVTAVLVGLLPPALLTMVSRNAESLREAAAAAARYGVGFSATVSLNATGKAQTLAAAAALFTAAAGLFSMSLSPKRNRSQRTSA